MEIIYWLVLLIFAIPCVCILFKKMVEHEEAPHYEVKFQPYPKGNYYNKRKF